MVVGSCAYCAQLGVGTADPIHSSWVSAVARPGAPSAAEYNAVGGTARKSPTPPRRMLRGNARPAPPTPPAPPPPPPPLPPSLPTHAAPQRLASSPPPP